MVSPSFHFCSIDLGSNSASDPTQGDGCDAQHVGDVFIGRSAYYIGEVLYVFLVALLRGEEDKSLNAVKGLMEDSFTYELPVYHRSIRIC